MFHIFKTKVFPSNINTSFFFFLIHSTVRQLCVSGENASNILGFKTGLKDRQFMAYTKQNYIALKLWCCESLSIKCYSVNLHCNFQQVGHKDHEFHYREYKINYQVQEDPLYSNSNTKFN